MTETKHTALPKLLPDRRSGQENGIVIKLRGMIWNVANTNQYVPEFPPETIRDEIITSVNERPALLAKLVLAWRVVEAARALREHQATEPTDADVNEWLHKLSNTEDALDAALKLAGEA